MQQCQCGEQLAMYKVWEDYRQPEDDEEVEPDYEPEIQYTAVHVGAGGFDCWADGRKEALAWRVGVKPLHDVLDPQGKLLVEGACRNTNGQQA